MRGFQAWADKGGENGILQRSVAGVCAAACRGDLAGAIAAKDGQAGVALAKRCQVTVIAAIKIRAAPDARKHQCAGRRMAARGQTIKALLHVDFSSLWLTNGPGQKLAGCDVIGQSYALVGVDRNDCQRAIVSFAKTVCVAAFRVKQDRAKLMHQWPVLRLKFLRDGAAQAVRGASSIECFKIETVTGGDALRRGKQA